MLTKHTAVMINEDLLDRLLVALHPIELGEDSDRYHIGYHHAQNTFRQILTHHLNKGPLVVEQPVETTPSAPTSGRRWWKR